MANSTLNALQLFGAQFSDPSAIRRAQRQQLAQALKPSGAQTGAAAGGFGAGMGIAALAEAFSGPSPEEQEAQLEQEVIAKTMKELNVQRGQDPAKLPAKRSADFARRLQENFFESRNYERAAHFAQAAAEQEAKALAQEQLVLSTDIAREAEEDREIDRALADQRILVAVDENGQVAGMIKDPRINGGKSVITGARSPEGIENIAAQIAAAEELGINMVPMSLDEYAREAFDVSKLKDFTGSEQKGFRAEVLSQTAALQEMEPLLRQIAEDPGALQGVAMTPDGRMKAGPVNGLFTALENYGQQARRAAEAAGYETSIFVGGEEQEGGLDEVVTEGMRQAGLSGSVARARVVGLAYAIARARDSGGRLSDQDVALALRTLTGTGSARELSTLFRDIVDMSRNKVDNTYAVITSKPDIVPPEARATFQSAYETNVGFLDQIDAVATERGQPPVPGSGETRQPTMRFNPETGQLEAIQ